MLGLHDAVEPGIEDVGHVLVRELSHLLALRHPLAASLSEPSRALDGLIVTFDDRRLRAQRVDGSSVHRGFSSVAMAITAACRAGARALHCPAIGGASVARCPPRGRLMADRSAGRQAASSSAGSSVRGARDRRVIWRIAAWIAVLTGVGTP